MSNILFISLGCDKNLVDSEKMIGLLAHSGHRIVDREEDADVIVINSCCFIHDAKEESIETILSMAEWKKKGRLKALIVAGCLAQRYAGEMEEEIPEVDAIIGTAGYDRIVSVVDEILKEQTEGEGEPAKGMISCLPSIDILPPSMADRRMVSTGAYTAYLKIAEGCNKRCSYCVIPSVRGSYRSFPMEDLVREAEILAAGGVRELILVAQETTVYGLDLYGRKCLPDLLKALCRIEGLEWIRLLYCYPEEITDDLITVMIEEPKICHYLDMPIQHSEDRILRMMGRRTSHKELTQLIARLRNRIPDIAIRTTLITGFPGETEEEFDRLLKFVEEMEFERLGVFPYSREEGTPAALMEGQVDEEICRQRRDAVMALQQEISAGIAYAFVGTVMDVMIDGYLYEEDVYLGRTFMDAPGIDGNVFVRSDRELISGDIVAVRINDSSEYDLIGDVIYADEFAQ